MLPRHLRPAIIISSSPVQIRALLCARNSLRPAASALQAHRVALHPSTALFHSSTRRQNEAPRSPFQIFVEVLRDEIRKNRELQDNVKQLQGDVDKLQDSEAMRKARAAYERARVRRISAPAYSLMADTCAAATAVARSARVCYPCAATRASKPDVRALAYL